jgi:hypothetical protein
MYLILIANKTNKQKLVPGIEKTFLRSRARQARKADVTSHSQPIF